MKLMLDKSQKAHWLLFVINKRPNIIAESIKFEGDLILYKLLGDDMDSTIFKVYFIPAVPDEKFFIEL